MTYLELVNRALKEAGVKKQPLTSGTFAAAEGSEIYSKIQNWVAEAYNNLQIDFDEYEFMQGKGTIILSPRVRVVDGYTFDGDPYPDSSATGAESGLTFEVITTTLISGTWAAGDAEADIDFHEMSGANYFKLNETFTNLVAAPFDRSFKIKDFGRYDLADYVSDFSDLRKDTLAVQDTGGSTVQTNSSQFNLRPLLFKPWSYFVHAMETTNSFRGPPSFFTSTPDGRLDFWPRLDKQYVFTFSYNKSIEELSAHDDTPTRLPEPYHMLIVWEAVKSYANYDSQPQLWTHAERKCKWYRERLDKRYLPEVSFEESRY